MTINKKILSYTGIILGIISYILQYIAFDYPDIVEQYYSHTFYPYIRSLLDNSLGLLPIPGFYILALVIVFFIIKLIQGHRRRIASAWQRWLQTGLYLAAFLGFSMTIFVWFWGFHYARQPIETQLHFQTQDIDSLILITELNWAKEALLNSYVPAGDRPKSAFLLKNIQHDLQQSQLRLGLPYFQKVSANQLWPSGILMCFGSSGVYLPWVGQANIDKGLHPIQKPFTMAHELAHGFGYTEEGTCNFLALLACTRSDDAFTRYAGYMAYFRYCASNYRALDEDSYLAFRAQLPAIIIQDLDAINQNMDSYPDLLPLMSLYEYYLKWQGISEGTQNYSKIITYMHAWRSR